MNPMFWIDSAVFTYGAVGSVVLKKVRIDCCAR